MLFYQHGLYFTGKAIVLFFVILIQWILLNRNKVIGKCFNNHFAAEAFKTFSRNYYICRNNERHVTGKLLFLRIHNNRCKCISSSNLEFLAAAIRGLWQTWFEVAVYSLHPIPFSLIMYGENEQCDIIHAVSEWWTIFIRIEFNSSPNSFLVSFLYHLNSWNTMIFNLNSFHRIH